MPLDATRIAVKDKDKHWLELIAQVIRNPTLIRLASIAMDRNALQACMVL